MTPSKAAEITYSPFPSDFLDPELKKQKKYNLDYAKAAYFEYIKDTQLLTGTRRNDFVNNRLYADGNQPNTKYKQPWYRTDETTKQEYSYSNLDYTPVSVIPGYRDIVLAYLEKMEYDIDLVAIDPVSDETRDTEMYTMWADKKLNVMLEQEEMMSLVTEQQDSAAPETMEELQILKQMPPKLRWELGMKGVLDLDFYRNNWPEIKKKLFEDLFDNGIAGVREFNTRDGRHILRYCDMVNMYIRMTRDKECKNSTAIGEMIEMTLADLMQQAKDQFTREEWIQIAKNATRPYSTSNEPYDYVDTDNLQSGGWLSWFTNRYGDARVKIFDLTWMTTDFYSYESKSNAAGAKIIYDKPFGHEVRDYEYSSEMRAGKMFYLKKDVKGGEPIEISKADFDNGVTQPKTSDRKAISEQVKMVYGCKWIMGTDFIYDYGQQYDIPRDPMPAGAETNLPFHIYRLTNKSIVERMKPFEDAFMQSWLKIQNAKARARPKGIKIELDALENMTIAGKKFTPLQALAVYDQSGNIIYKGTGQFGEPTRHSPVEETQGGMGAEYAELIGDLNFNVSMMRQVSGFNEIFLASSPDPNQPVGTAELAVEASSNALYPLLSSLQNIHVRAAKSTICRYQLVSHYKNVEGYDMALSEPMRKAVEYSDDFSLYKYGIKVIARPTKEQRAKIEAAAIEAMRTKDETGTGQITYPDYLFILRILDGGNMHYAEAVLAYRIQKRKQEKTQEQQAMIKANGEEQRASAAQAEEDKRATLAFETDQKIRLATVEGEIQKDIDTNKLLLVKQNELIKANGKLKQTETQTAGKLIGEEMKVTAKAKEGKAKKKKVPA